MTDPLYGPCARCGKMYDEHPGGFCPDQVGPDGLVDVATVEAFVPVPNLGDRALILYGHAGHDMEFTITFADYDHDRPIPADVFDAFTAFAPEYRVENRGSRLEVHPSGRLFQRVSDDEVAGAWIKIKAALRSMGVEPVDTYQELHPE